MKHLEIITITHKSTNVDVKIDYDNKQISFVERQTPTNQSVWNPKPWIFAKRGPEYVNGWLEVLEAMKVATLFAKKALEDHIKEEEKAHIDHLIALEGAEKQLVKSKKNKK